MSPPLESLQNPNGASQILFIMALVAISLGSFVYVCRHESKARHVAIWAILIMGFPVLGAVIAVVTLRLSNAKRG